MRERYEPDAELVRASRQEPIVLVGPAGDLSGHVTLENPTAANVILRQGTVRLDAGAGGAADVRAIVAPGQSRRVPVKARLDGAVAAGEYRGEVTIGGRPYPLVVHVVEIVRLDVTPGLVLVDGPPGTTVTKRVVVTNRGSVPVELRAPADIVVEAELSLEDEPERRALPVAFAALTLAPGDLGAIELAVTLPADIPPRGRWLGVVPLATTEVEVVVTPAPAPKPAAKTAARAKKKVSS